MKKKHTFKNLLLTLGFSMLSSASIAQIQPQFISRFSTGIYNNTAAEISAYDPITKRMFVLNGADTSIKVVDISNPANPQLISSISLKPYGIDPTSVAAKNGVVGVTVIDSMGKTENGKVVFFSSNTLNYINQVDVGANPDMLTFTPDGSKILVANEGEPDVVGYDEKTGEYIFIDCSDESPAGRRSLCYDREALDARKWAFAAEVVRFYAVYTEGGIYMDSDIYLHRRFDEILPEDGFATFNEKD